MICFALPFRTKSAYLSAGHYHPPRSVVGGRLAVFWKSTSTYLLDPVEEGVPYVPLDAVAHLQPPGELGLVQVHQQADGQVAELDLLVVKAGARDAEEERQPWQELGEVAKARDGGDEGAGRLALVGDEQGHSQVPQGHGDREADPGTIFLDVMVGGQQRWW